MILTCSTVVAKICRDYQFPLDIPALDSQFEMRNQGSIFGNKGAPEGTDFDGSLQGYLQPHPMISDSLKLAFETIHWS